jgi:hypothetical protein
MNGLKDMSHTVKGAASQIRKQLKLVQTEVVHQLRSSIA